jgi:molybdate transport system substrate-binding protein
VRAVLTKVALGEADAGIVYESDTAGSEVTRIPIPAGLNVAATYAIAPVAGSATPELAGSFIRFVLSREGQAILARHGFLPAEPAAP